jgi:eukaryotic-like serine/threonine-protein kinase
MRRQRVARVLQGSVDRGYAASAVSTSAQPGSTDTLVHPGDPLPLSRGYETYGERVHAPLQRGASIGRYVVLETLGSGGMGIVYAAFDPELDRKVALKLLRPGARRDPETARARLMREAQALAKVSHPSVIAVHDVGTYGDQVFVAMEFVDGSDMAQWLAERPRHHVEILPLMRMAGEGLAAAHAAGLVHRDFKPENVLVGHDGRVRVVDFGLARPTDDDDDVRDRHALPSAAEPAEPNEPYESYDGADTADIGATLRPQHRLTQAGAVMGTPRYMAAEQHRGDAVDARTDQFSFCVALHEALYREHPFAGNTVPQIAFNVLQGHVREPSRDAPAVPAWIRRVVLRGLSVDPADRWPDMPTLLAALGRDPTVRRWRLATAVALVAIILTAGALLLAGSDDETCRGAERKLIGVWDAQVRERLEQTYARVDRPYADDAYAATRTLLDSYATRWVELHTEACRATAIRREQSQEVLDRQMLCLDRRLKEVATLTGLLLRADDGVVQESVRAVTRLPPLEPCSDLEALMAETPPLAGEQAERVAHIEDMLAQARNLHHLARYEDGHEVARDALGAARATDHAPSVARALLLLGRSLNELARTEEAERTLLEAIWAADLAQTDLVRAEAWKDLIWVVGVRQHRYEDASLMHEHAMRALQRAGGSHDIEGELHNTLGVIARRRGDDAKAIEHHQDALSLRREHLAPDDPRLADSLINLANALGAKGRLDEADAAIAEAQRLIEHGFGPSHPRMAHALHNRGVLAYRRADYVAAANLLRSATTIRVAALPPEHPDVAGALHDLGEVLLRLHEIEPGHAAPHQHEAVEIFSRAVALRETNLGPQHVHLANSLRGLGQALAGLGRTDEAAQALERALAIRQAPEVDPISRAESQFALAQALAGRDADRALSLARAARAAYAQSGEHADSVVEIEAWLAQHR